MVKPQYQRVFEAAKEREELPSALDMYSRALHHAKLISAPDDMWVRIDTVVREREIFSYVAYSLGLELARDSDGNIYVTKDHAIGFSHQWQHQATERELDVGNWALLLAIIVGLVILRRCIG